MKKKIINGILMSALLIAGTTSFVSCKDNVDDVETGIRQDMSSLQTKITELETKLNNITPKEYDDSALKQQIENLKSEISSLKESVTTNTGDITALKDRIQKVEDALAALSKTMVTGVIVQETLDHVVGTINLLGFNPGFLASYVGENLSGMPEFPIAGDDYNVDPDGNSLKNSEINVDPVWNSGKKSYLINGTGNAGTIYFTLNPRKVDPSVMQFDLINSTGEVSPVELSEVEPSSHLITNVIGKHGNGLTRADELVAANNEKTYLYQAKATVSLEGIEKIHYDWTKFGYNNLWDAGKEMVGTEQSAEANAQSLFGRFTYMVKALSQIGTDYSGDGKKENTQIYGGILDKALKMLQDFYNGVYQQREKLQKQALRVSWDDGENDVISDFDITTVTINPLNWKQMYWFDSMKPQWNVTGLSGLVNKFVTAVQSKLPNVSGLSISFSVPTITATTNPELVGVKFVVSNGTEAAYVWTGAGWVDENGSAIATPGPTFATEDVMTTMNKLIAQINTGAASINAINSQIASLLKVYNSVKTATATNIMSRVDYYLNIATNDLYARFEGKPAYRLTEPMLLFESNYGINRLEANMKIKGNNLPMTFIMTSLTEEYIVPVYMKYVALLVGGKVQQSYLVPGSEKIVSFNIPDEPCEIVYQASDFYGNVVTKRYPLNR